MVAIWIAHKVSRVAVVLVRVKRAYESRSYSTGRNIEKRG